jgi:poly(A) polymerase
MIFARPYPRDFSDKSRPLHCFYFIGLWKKQTGQAQEAEQFDIRGIVNEFKTFIFASQNWKDGMDIEVSHVKRKEIPLFVFPDGVRPRSSRTKNKICHTVPKNDVSADGYVGNGSSNVNFSDAQPAPYESSHMKKTEPDSSGRCHLPGGISVLASRLPNKDALDGLVDCNTAPVQQEQAGHYHGNTSGPEKDVLCNVIHESNHMLPNSPNDLQTNEFGSFCKKSQRETSKNTANMFMNLSPAIPVAPDVLDEPASNEGTSNQKDDNVGQREFSDGYSEKSQGQTNTLNSHVYNHLKRKANEELEVLYFLLCNSFQVLFYECLGCKK